VIDDGFLIDNGWGVNMKIYHEYNVPPKNKKIMVTIIQVNVFVILVSFGSTISIFYSP